MKRLLFIALLPVALLAQPTVVQSKGFDTSSTTTSDTLTFASGTTTGNAILCYSRSNKTATQMYTNGQTTSAWNLADNASPPNTYTAVVPNRNGYLIGVSATTGTGYFSAPSVAVTGCSSAGSYAASTSGSTPSITVAGMALTTIASGCGPTLPTVAFSGGTPITGTPATITASVIGLQNTQSSAMFLAYNITGAASHVITFNHVSSDYHGLVCSEINLGNTTNPLDAVDEGGTTSSVTHITAATFAGYTTSQANEIAFMATTLEATSNTWTPSSGWTSAADSTGTSGGLLSLQYKVYTSIQTGVTQDSQTANHSAAMSAMVVTLKATPPAGGGVRHKVISSSIKRPNNAN